MGLKKSKSRLPEDIGKAIAANTNIMKNSGSSPARAKAAAVNFVNENLPADKKVKSKKK